MPIVTGYQDAVRQILSVVNTAWLTTGLPLLFQNTNQQLPASSSSWARVTLTHLTGTQRTLSLQRQIYNNKGILSVQIFVPSGTGIASTTQAQLVQLVIDALRGVQTPGGVFFTDVHAQEIGISEHWYQTNVMCSWQYDDIVAAT
jgi:hypothetical protein